MGLGGTAKKIQILAEKAEQTYEKMNELRTEVQHTQETVNDTADRVQRLEVELAEQRAVLDAVATEVGVDLESVSTDAHITEAEHPDANGEGSNATSEDEASDATSGDEASDGTADEEPAPE